MIFFNYFQSIFDIKIQKKKRKKENASERVIMLVLCVNMQFQLKSTSWGNVHNNIDHYMLIETEPIY